MSVKSSGRGRAAAALGVLTSLLSLSCRIRSLNAAPSAEPDGPDFIGDTEFPVDVICGEHRGPSAASGADEDGSSDDVLVDAGCVRLSGGPHIDEWSLIVFLSNDFC
jgi:hypothetical protein